MRKLLLSILIFAGYYANAQITVSSITAANAATAITKFAIPSNAMFTGNVNSLGSYSCVGCNLGLTNGIVITTGDRSGVAHPASYFSNYSFSNPGLTELSALISGTTTRDAAYLEYDLIPLQGYLKVTFTYASEEYPEYANFNFSDPMGIFLSGPGIPGTVNLALIPGTSQIVNTSTIHDSSYAGPCSNCQFYIDNVTGTDLSFDGLTTTITTTVPVQAGSTYHIKIAIADSFDDLWDSGILIGNNMVLSDSIPGVDCASFTANIYTPPVSCNTTRYLRATLSQQGNFIYDWQPAGIFANHNAASPKLLHSYEGQVILNVTDTVSNCTVSDTATVRNYFDEVITIDQCHIPTAITLDPGLFNAASYNWSDGSTSQVNMADTTIDLTCTVSVFGCSFEIEYNVTDTCDCKVRIIPSADTTCGSNNLFATVIPHPQNWYSFSWQYPGGATGSSVNITDLLINQPVIVTAVNLNNGCIAIDTAIITNFSNASDSVGICGNDTMILQLPPAASNISWSYQTDTSSSPVALTDTTISLTATQQGIYNAQLDYPGCAGNSYTFILTDTCIQTVWPGDADHNLGVDMTDLLYIGLGNNSTGSARTPASINWTGQPVSNWQNTFLNGVNYAHADCDGNGTINMSDTIAIIQNFGLTHPPRIPETVQVNPYPVSIDLVPNIIGQGQTVTGIISIGDASNIIDSIYGISFHINGDPLLINWQQVSDIEHSSSVLGVNQNTIYGLTIKDNINHIIHSGVTRVDHVNATNVSGVLGTFNFKTNTNLANSGYLYMTLSDIVAVKADGQLIPMTGNSDSVYVDITISAAEINNSSVNIYPNPVTDKLYIEGLSGKNFTVELFDAKGSLVISKSYTDKISMSELSKGIYSVKLITDDGVSIYKVIKD